MKKTQILIAHHKQRIDQTKKVRLETRGFCTYFWEVDHPLWDVCMEKTQILIAHQKQRIEYFWEVDHPLWDICMEKTQILIAHQKQRIDRTKKVRLADKKSSARD